MHLLHENRAVEMEVLGVRRHDRREPPVDSHMPTHKPLKPGGSLRSDVGDHPLQLAPQTRAWVPCHGPEPSGAGLAWTSSAMLWLGTENGKWFAAPSLPLSVHEADPAGGPHRANLETSCFHPQR